MILRFDFLKVVRKPLSHPASVNWRLRHHTSPPPAAALLTPPHTRAHAHAHAHAHAGGQPRARVAVPLPSTPLHSPAPRSCSASSWGSPGSLGWKGPSFFSVSALATSLALFVMTLSPSWGPGYKLISTLPYSQVRKLPLSKYTHAGVCGCVCVCASHVHSSLQKHGRRGPQPCPPISPPSRQASPLPFPRPAVLFLYSSSARP